MLIATAVLPVAGTFDRDQKCAISFRFKPVIIPHSTYEPQDIDLRDAAFHRSHGRYLGGWWYFEGIFDNGYSAVCGISHFSREDRGFGALKLHIYNNTKLIFNEKKLFTFKEFETSEEFPLIEVSGKQIMRLDRERYNSTGEWAINVSIEIEKYQANLQFVGTTKGWKGELLRGWYGPVLPKAEVEGTLTLNGEIINVSGLGYHEHSWNIPLTIWEWGWYWGKVVSENLTLAGLGDEVCAVVSTKIVNFNSDVNIFPIGKRK